MFHIGKSIETRVRGSVYKTVRCDNCECEFVYQLSRYALGSASGSRLTDTEALRELALRSANASLRALLERGEDPVPCPSCGNYQQSMIPLLKRKQRFGMFLLAIFFLVIAVIFSILCALAYWSRSPANDVSPRSFGEGALWTGGIGIGLLLVRKLLNAQIRPNDGDPEQRRQLARTLAMTKSEFEQRHHQANPETQE